MTGAGSSSRVSASAQPTHSQGHLLKRDSVSWVAEQEKSSLQILVFIVPTVWNNTPSEFHRLKQRGAVGKGGGVPEWLDPSVPEM